jgi:hypothetical protein
MVNRIWDSDDEFRAFCSDWCERHGDGYLNTMLNELEDVIGSPPDDVDEALAAKYAAISGYYRRLYGGD